MLWSKRRRENRNVQQQLDAPQMEHERFAERWKLCHVPFLKCALACTIYGQIWGTTATPCLFPRPKEIQSQTSKNSGSNWCLTVHHKLMSLAVIPNRRDEGRCDFGKWTPRWYFWSIQKSSWNPKSATDLFRKQETTINGATKGLKKFEKYHCTTANFLFLNQALWPQTIPFVFSEFRFGATSLTHQWTSNHAISLRTVLVLKQPMKNEDQRREGKFKRPEDM